MKKQLVQLGSLTFFSFVLLGFGVPRCDDLEQLCNSAAEISAKTEIRCGSNRTLDEAVKAFKEKVAFGDCKTIKSVRDAQVLITDCLPWLENASCELLNEGRILPACLNQFSTKTQ